jgi:hypothetical protein
MKQRMSSAAAALVLLGALGQGTAGAAPKPSYSVTCQPGGFTQVSWKRAKLDQITLEWTATTGSYDPTVRPVSPTPPKGILTASPLGPGTGPTSVTVTFGRADGSTDVVTASCT